MLAKCFIYDESTGYPTLYVPVSHVIRHDLDSLAWVAEYVLFRKAHQAVAHLPPQHARRKEIEESFAREFGTVEHASMLTRQRGSTAACPRSASTLLQKIWEELDLSLTGLIIALVTLVQNFQVDSEDIEVLPPEVAERMIHRPVPILSKYCIRLPSRMTWYYRYASAETSSFTHLPHSFEWILSSRKCCP